MRKNLFLVLAFLMLSAAMLAACSDSNDSPQIATEMPASTAPMTAAPQAVSWGGSLSEEEEDFFTAFDSDNFEMYSVEGAMTVQSATFAPTTHNETIGVPPIITPSQAGDRMFVYTIHYSLQTTTFMPGVRTLLDMVASHRGHTMRAVVNGHDLRWPEMERSANFVFRVPSENIPRFIEEMERHFNLLHWDLSAVEETRTYQENLSAVADARDREARLLEELENAATANLRRNLEADLRNAQNEIRRLEAALAAIESNVIYSDVTVWLHEVILAEEKPVPTFGQLMASTANDSWFALIGALQGIMLFLVAALPILLPLLAIAVFAWWRYRIIKKHEAEKEKDENAEE